MGSYASAGQRGHGVIHRDLAAGAPSGVPAWACPAEAGIGNLLIGLEGVPDQRGCRPRTCFPALPGRVVASRRMLKNAHSPLTPFPPLRGQQARMPRHVAERGTRFGGRGERSSPLPPEIPPPPPAVSLRPGALTQAGGGQGEEVGRRWAPFQHPARAGGAERRPDEAC